MSDLGERMSWDINSLEQLNKEESDKIREASKLRQNCDECDNLFFIDDMEIIRVPPQHGCDQYYCKPCRERLDNE